MLSSVGKMFTAVAIARLVEKNQLSFESKLGSLLPEYPSSDARDRVTVRHLLSMSSGIPDLFRVPRFWAEIGTIRSSTDMWKYFADSPLQFAPGTQWAYSNSNYLLLGEIIERVTRRQFETVVEQEIFRSLQMTNTSYRINPARRPALGYTLVEVGGDIDSRWTPAWKEPQPGSEFRYMLVVLGNSESSGTQDIASHVRARVTSSKANWREYRAPTAAK